MSALKLNIEEFDAIDFQLLAIHTSLEDYRLAYFINQAIAVNLSKDNTEITIKNKAGETSFSHFSFEDEKKGVCWDLIQNKTEIVSLKKQKGQGLFAETESQVLTKVYLLPEYSKVDFFLRVENTDEIENTTTVVSKINTIDRVSTAYLIETEKIKSKNNLIF
jgi:hypothetical protein